MALTFLSQSFSPLLAFSREETLSAESTALEVLIPVCLILLAHRLVLENMAFSRLTVALQEKMSTLAIMRISSSSDGKSMLKLLRNMVALAAKLKRRIT